MGNNYQYFDCRFNCYSISSRKINVFICLLVRLNVTHKPLKILRMNSKQGVPGNFDSANNVNKSNLMSYKHVVTRIGNFRFWTLLYSISYNSSFSISLQSSYWDNVLKQMVWFSLTLERKLFSTPYHIKRLSTS